MLESQTALATCHGFGAQVDQNLGLRVLGRLMKWSDDRAVDEFRWLRLMAAVKYDGYGDFRAGMRFIESLAKWLQQFEFEDRESAYRFVRGRLTYLGPAEMAKLVHLFYPRRVQHDLDTATVEALGVGAAELLINEPAQEYSRTLLRKTLFMALSDGARLDEFRHSNAGLISNEQLVTSTQLDQAKWEDMLDELRKELKDDGARFSQIYLIDDFAGTGTSFFRLKETDKSGAAVWGGKLWRFRASLLAQSAQLNNSIMEDSWRLYVHHYVGTSKAESHMRDVLAAAEKDLADPQWASEVSVSFGMLFDQRFPLSPPLDQEFIDLTSKYYDSHIEDRHTKVGGVKHQGLGYGATALPLVLDHNTPNNSIALLWAESERPPETGERSMTPLFRRRKRHA